VSDEGRIEVRMACAGDERLAEAAGALVAAAALEHDLALRPVEWLAEKLRAGHAALALERGELVGFGYWSAWDAGRWVSHSGLVVRADRRGLGLGRRLKLALLASSRAALPEARTLSLTTSPAVRALNLRLGFREAAFEELTEDPAFWAACQTCRNFAAARAAGRRCCCMAMLLAPAGGAR
jgi:GNAT superfamily N-acetyltransferase